MSWSLVSRWDKRFWPKIEKNNPKVWRQFPDRIVGFPSRTHFWQNSTTRLVFSSFHNQMSDSLTKSIKHFKFPTISPLFFPASDMNLSGRMSCLWCWLGWPSIIPTGTTSTQPHPVRSSVKSGLGCCFGLSLHKCTSASGFIHSI